MKNIDPSIIRGGSIIKCRGSLWVAVRGEDIRWADVVDSNIMCAHGWYWRRTMLPCPPSEPERKDQMNFAPFFTCFVEGTDGGEHVQHHNRGIAKIEAERLSGQSNNLGKKVYVMKAVAYCKSTKPEVTWND